MQPLSDDPQANIQTLKLLALEQEIARVRELIRQAAAGGAR